MAFVANFNDRRRLLTSFLQITTLSSLKTGHWDDSLCSCQSNLHVLN